MPSLAFLLKAKGAFLMLHAAYSCMHYRSLLQDLDLLDTTSESPLDVYVEVGLAFFLILIGELMSMGPLSSVEVVFDNATSSTTNTKKKTPLAAHPHKTRDFDVYSNRSKLLLRKMVVSR